MGGHNTEDESDLRIKMAEHNFRMPPGNDEKPRLDPMCICLTQARWGAGECGPKLLENLLITLSQSNVKPRWILLMDSAVFLATDNTILDCQDAWKFLIDSGVEVLISETSARHYDQLSCIRFGTVIKFHHITDLLLRAEKFVSL